MNEFFFGFVVGIVATVLYFKYGKPYVEQTERTNAAEQKPPLPPSPSLEEYKEILNKKLVALLEKNKR